jgi:hypothetical protein
MEVEKAGRKNVECLSRTAHSDLWKKLWSLKIPNTEKNFLWRACHRLLPTKDSLAERKITPDLLCLICLQEAETPFHVLWACPSAMDAWGVSNRIFQKTVIETGDFFNVAEAIFTKGTRDEAAIFARTARKLWLRRNDRLDFQWNFHAPDGVGKDSEAGPSRIYSTQ